MPDSLRPQPSNFEWTCPSCGSTFIAKSAHCPKCSTYGGQRGDELTKKIVDDNDLKKGGLR